jgi:methylase of polypeptide subunit release factors
LAIFQKSVLNSIKQDESLVASRWNNFQNYIGKIDAIRGFKEEVYQDGFFKDIFESCLGYTLKITNPNDYNLEREKKNETDGKKADGVIYVNGDVIGIVELKDQKTKNLDQVEGQAFNYHNSHSNSKYVIISNFDEVRFYIDKKTAYEKFNLFNLPYDDFRTLHLLISYESIRDNIPLKLKEKSTNFEQTISKELYRDFSAFRTHLFENIVKNNYTPVIPCHDTESTNSEWIPNQVRYDEGLDKQTLLRLTQKLCDRIIFILFAEDRELLKKETIKEIRTRHANDGFGDRSMYDYYKLYFNAINTGNDKLGIPKYNGGLFATDELLDSLIIDDTYLDMEAQKLSDFDFVSDISVNILGHIFEQSLTDLEEMNASINDTEFDKKKSKRKKDGVFYTPEYITRYIVENTLGKLCSDKKAELKIESETVVLNPRKLTKSEQSYKETLIAYREWLTHLKILDPACGSGAFLNQALEFLIREHTLIRDLLLPYEDLMIGYEIEKSILEHNLYGVDINEDAVEIARLSLWLRTAHKGRELINLGAKIKCGNSLISDRNVAENAFVWEDEFPEVFAQGGFDVVIGNPPYVSTKQIPKSDREFFWNKYKELLVSEMDLYEIFLYENLHQKLRINGLIGFITPNTYYTNASFEKLRMYLIEKSHILQIIDFPYRFFPFEDVNTETSILILQKEDFEETFLMEVCTASKDLLNKNSFIDDAVKLNKTILFQSQIKDSFEGKIVIKQSTLLVKLLKSQKKFGDYLELHKGWMSIPEETYLNDRKISQGIFSLDEINQYQIEHICCHYLEGKDIHRYFIDPIAKYVNIEKIDIKTQEWHFSKKIILQRIVGQNKNKIFATYDDKNFIIFPNANLVNCRVPDRDIKVFLAILNSSLINYFYNVYYGESNTNVTKAAFENLPLVDIKENEQVLLITRADLMLDLTKQLQIEKHNFLNELHLEKIPQKLQKFEELEFDEFVKEYTKTKKLKFADKLEERNFKNDWMALFENDKKVVLELKEQITKTDKEIDAMVYALYGLSADEIGIVEGSK